MKSISKQTIFIIINMVLIFAIFAFIFGNSLQNRATSSQESLCVFTVLSNFLENTIGYSNLTHNIVRKFAHFCEFTALGFFTLHMWVLLRRMQWHYILHGLFLGLACAVADESLQLLSDRDARVSDILLDFSGVMFGCVVFLFIYTAYRIWKRRFQKH